MNPTVRGIVAVVVGVVTASITVFAVESISNTLYPMPSGLDPTVPEQLRAHVGSLPMLAFVIVLSAWTLGTFVGGLLAARIAGRAPLRHAAIVAGFILAATIMNLVMLPHPVWVALLAVLLIPLAAWCASLVATPST